MFTKQERQNFSLLDNSRMKHTANSVPIRTKNESLAHFLKKCETAFSLVNEGKIIFCEPLLRDNDMRPDILNLTDSEVIEIQSSETDGSIEHKRKIYNLLGLNFKVIKI